MESGFKACHRTFGTLVGSGTEGQGRRQGVRGRQHRHRCPVPCPVSCLSCPMEFTVSEPQWVKQRLDQFLHAQLPDLSRTRLQGLVKDGDILLNGKTAKPNAALKLGDQVTVEVPEPVLTE